MNTCMTRQDIDLRLLRQVTQAPASSQRHLAQGLGISVGRVNHCLRALVAKGWIKVDNFRRSDNKLAYAYLLTPSGMRAKTQLTRRFLQAKLAEYERLQAEIAALQFEAERDLQRAEVTRGAAQLGAPHDASRPSPARPGLGGRTGRAPTAPGDARRR